jgi:hypothetical protein
MKKMQAKTVVVVAVVIAVAALSSGVSAADIPVSARLTTGSSPLVELKNVGDRAVTAWSFVVRSRNPQGGDHREVHTADVYLSEVTRGLPRSAEHLDWLRPGESRTIPVDAAPAGASVEMVAVVLEDGTALGDDATIKSFFEHRAFERDELEKIVETLNAVLQKQHGLEALESLKVRLAVSEGDESVPHRAAREAVDTLLARAQAGSVEDAERSARLYADFVGRQYELAVKHARPGRESGSGPRLEGPIR